MKSPMSKRACVVVAVLALLALPAAAQVKHHSKIRYPELPEFKIPKPEVYELGNGMTVFLLEDHELPMIEVSAMIRTGAAYEPADKVGLAGIMGQVQREGGTTSMSGDELDDWLGDRAASIETFVGNDSGGASMSCLKEDFDEVFAKFNDVLRRPAFAEDRLEVGKSRANTGIARRNDDVGEITSREFTRLVYGKDSPLARNVEYATIAAITRDDLVAWHKKYYHPNNVLLGVVGDFDSAAMKKKIEATFGNWSRGPAFDAPEVAYAKPKPGVYFIPKQDVTQANIRMGHHGITVKNPDFFSVQVMNEVLGGSFASRLFSNVRSKKGLAYSVFGSVGASFNHPGVCQVGLQTKSETMSEAVEALKEEVRGIIDNPPTGEELQRAKESILNSFIFNYASREQVLNQQMNYAYYGLPADFLEKYRSRIEKVTAEQVAAVAKKYVLPQEAVLLVVGKEQDFDKPMKSFGEFETVDISIPPMPDTSPKIAVTDTGLKEGAALMAKVAAALGADRLADASAIKIDGKLAVSMGGQTMGLTQKAVTVYPDKARVVIGTPMGEQTMVLDGESGFMQGGGQTMPMPPEMVAEQRENLARDLQFLVKYHDDPGLTAVAGGKEKIGNVECRILAVEFRGAKSRLWVAPDGKVLKQAYQGKNPMTRSPAQVESLLSDYRNVEGMQVPHKMVITMDGAEFATMTIESFEVDPPVDLAMFQKPEA